MKPPRSTCASSSRSGLRWGPWIALGAFGLQACFQQPSSVQVTEGTAGSHATGATRTGGEAGGTSAGASSSGSSGGGASSGGATTSGGTSGGSSASGGSTGSTLPSCGASQFLFAAEVLDAISGDPIPGLVVTAYTPTGVPFENSVPGATCTSDANGNVDVCLPGGQDIYLGINGGADYPRMATSDFYITGADDTGRRLSVLSESDEEDLTSLVDGVLPNAPLNLALPIIEVEVLALPGTPCESQLDGWQFQLLLPDGGPMPAGPDGGPPFELSYLGSDGLPPPVPATATSTKGTAIFYDIETPLDSLMLTAVNTSADAGACPVTTSPLQMTGAVLVAPGALCYAPIDIP